MNEQPKEKKKGFFRRNKNKIAKITSIIINVLYAVGFGVVALLHITVPPVALGSSVVVALFTVVFHAVADKYPEKLEEIKNIFIKKLDDEDDKQSIQKAYEDVISKYSQDTERTIINEPYNNRDIPSAPPTIVSSQRTPSEKNEDDIEIEKMNAYFNKRTKEYMITPRNPFPKK